MPAVDLKLQIDYTGLPEGLRSGARLWVEHGVQPGNFLSAVIANNLKESVIRADNENMDLLYPIIVWFYNEAPSGCWGSVASAKTWAALHDREFVPEWLIK